MDINRILTYSLLACINNNKSNIRDLGDIFVPLVKRVISLLFQEGVNKGLLGDLKSKVDSTYSIDMPYPLLRNIMSKICDDMNRTHSDDFIFNNDGSFTIKQYVFADYEEIITEQEKEIDIVVDTYNNYLKSQGIEINSQPTIFEFIDKNRVSLSHLFSKSHDATLDSKYIIQANFISGIKNSSSLFNILRKIYLGSIISTYLESNLYENNIKEFELLFDTNFIISTLDLHSPESTHTCHYIIDLCNKSGYKLKVLNFTIEETTALLNRIAGSIDGIKLFEQIDTDNIYNSCKRRRLTKTDLQRIASNISIKLKKDFNIHTITDQNKLRELAKKTEIYEKLQNRRSNPSGALHDATAILYIQNKRKHPLVNFHEANSWFVTDTKKEFNNIYKKDGYLLEVIRAEDLINILWLSNPMFTKDDLSDLGLTQLVSITINKSLPSAKLLRELDDNIQKYAIETFEPSDYVQLANTVATQTIINLNNVETLNDLARKSPEEFISKLKEYSEQAKEEEKKRTLKTNQLIKSIIDDFDTKLAELKKELNLNIASKRDTLDGLISTRKSLSSVKLRLDKLAETNASKFLWFIIGLNVLAICSYIILINKFTWQVIEPYTVYLPFVLIIVQYIYIAVNKRSLNPIDMYNNSIKYEKIYKKFDFDINYFNQISEKIKTLEDEIGNLDIPLVPKTSLK